MLFLTRTPGVGGGQQAGGGGGRCRPSEAAQPAHRASAKGGGNGTLSGKKGVKDERGADELSPTTKIRHHDVPPTEWDGPAASPSKWHVGRSLEGSCPLSLGFHASERAAQHRLWAQCFQECLSAYSPGRSITGHKRNCASHRHKTQHLLA